MTSVLVNVEWLGDQLIDGLARDGTVRVPELGVFTLCEEAITYKPAMPLKMMVWPLPDDLGGDDDEDDEDEDDDDVNPLLDQLAAILRTGRTVEIPGVGELLPVAEGSLRTIAFRPSPELVRRLGR